jgi:uncharacterized protein (TIGR02271 family)
MTHTVVGLFNNRSDAQAAMQELVQNGFIQEDIDLSNRRLDETAGTAATTTDTASTGTGIGDSISNFFSSLFGDDPDTASSYTNAAYDADAILTIQVDSSERASEAAEILDRHNAIDVDEHNAQYSRGNYADTSSLTNDSASYANTTDSASYASTTDSTNYSNTTGTMDTETMNEARSRTDLDNEARIPVIEENLQVGKREVERGGARIRSRVIEKPVEANVRLREEHVIVNRHPVNRAATEADFNNVREGEFELTEHAEVPIVGKQARVVEEVEVGKTVEEHDQTVRDTVRRTDVEVDELSGDADIDHTGTRRATS